MSSVGGQVTDTLPERRERTWAQNAVAQAPVLKHVAFYAIVANFPYWLVAHAFGFAPFGWFCVSYIVAGAIALVVPRIVAAMILFAIIIIDLLCGVCLTFDLPARECLANLSVEHEFSGLRLFSASAACLLVPVIATVGATLCSRGTMPNNQRWQAARWLALFAVLISGADALSIVFVSGRIPLRDPQDRMKPARLNVPRLARIPIVRLIRFEKYEVRVKAFDKNGPASAFPVPSATELAVRRAIATSEGSSGELPNIVLVLVESWGLAVDGPLNEAMVEPYLRPEMVAKYEVIRGSVPFYGPTIPGEARELCASGIGFHLVSASAGDLQTCQPTRLGALGYDTIGVHGMSGNMFNRSVWYRTIGFQERWFHEQFKQQGLPDCSGAFIGTCDADIAVWIGRRLREDASRPIFLHWMTLNSHLPVPVPTQLSSPVPCSANLGLQPSSLCSWYQLVANVHHSVSELALGPLGRPTIFVIVGDHAPPFGDPGPHDRFSQDNVPYVLLFPRAQREKSK